MSDKHAIHHINYEFAPAGLTPAECEAHASAAAAALAAHFNIDASLVRTKWQNVRETLDIRVMRAAGSTHDYDRNFDAYKVAMPLLRAAQYQPKVVRVVAPPQDLGRVVTVRVARPPVSKGL